MGIQSNLDYIQVLLEVDFGLAHASVEDYGKLFGATVNNTGPSGQLREGHFPASQVTFHSCLPDENGPFKSSVT